ncbi:MAG: alpha/beta fold hydrolase [Burkholderiaceae bacterium]
MAHVTFIHGIANKPPADDLLAIWRRTLAQATDAVSLGDLGVTSSLVYWADLMYEKPDDDLSAYEGVLENTVAAIDASGGAEMPIPKTAEEAAFLDSLRRRLTTLGDDEIDARLAEQEIAPATAVAAAGALERVPLPWFLKKPLMSVLLRDVHHYLFDTEFAPPGKPPTHIRQAIRERFVDALSAPGITAPHVVVAHSMGTVIAYDCLKRVEGCVAVDGLITIGSPLGLDEIQDKLQPEWSRANGFPHLTVSDRWINLFDRLDPVCGFDPKLDDDYRDDGTSRVVDQAVVNSGAWRHSATKYLRQPAFCSALRSLLRV